MGSQDSLLFGLYKGEKMLSVVSREMSYDLNHTKSYSIFGALTGTIQKLHQLEHHLIKHEWHKRKVVPLPSPGSHNPSPLTTT